jgi:hypothetical protein
MFTREMLQMLKKFQVQVVWNIYVPSQVSAEVTFQFHIKQKLGSKWIRTTLVELFLMQGIRLLSNPKVHCSAHNCLPPNSVLNQMKAKQPLMQFP